MTGFIKHREPTQKIVMLETALLRPNRSQPRKEFDECALRQLSDSIKENGMLQPVCVRKNGALYEIISGERRTRAAKLAGLCEIPCIVMNVDDEKSAVLALIENIQRKNLNYFEEALAIEKLISVYGLTQETAAERLGKAQSTIANKLRLLRFSDEERSLLSSENISERQARALIRISDESLRMRTLQKVVEKKLNLEQTEKLVADIIEEKPLTTREKHSTGKMKKLMKQFPQPPRLYMNSINNLIKQMRDAKIPCETQSEKKDGYYEYIIRFPVSAV
ncbi:MAG: ParB/RepB/Spo0J family partition protein [Oscillospiraceae bacterium]